MGSPLLEIKIDNAPKYRADIDDDPAIAAHTLISANPDAERVWVRCCTSNRAAVSARVDGELHTERCEALDPIWLALHRANRVEMGGQRYNKIGGLWFGDLHGLPALNCAGMSKFLRDSSFKFKIQIVDTIYEV